MFWKIAHFLANRWDQFHMFLCDQIHINRVGPGTFLHVFHCCEHWDFLFWTPLVPLVADVDVLLLKGKLGTMLERLKIRLSPRN